MERKQWKKGGSLVLPLFPVCAEINQASCQCWDSAGDGKLEFLAPCSEGFLVLLTEK